MNALEIIGLIEVICVATLVATFAAVEVRRAWRNHHTTRLVDRKRLP